MWPKAKAINLLLPLLYLSLNRCRMEGVTMSRTFGLDEIPNDIEVLYHGTSPSPISCGIRCKNFANAISIIVCKDSNNAIDCYCTTATDFSHTSADGSCVVYTKQLCKNFGYFDGEMCNCEDGFMGPLCEITCQEEKNLTLVDPMNTEALEKATNGEGPLKQQIHLGDLDIMYNTVFTSREFGGISESPENLEIDVLNQSNSDVYLVHLMFYSSNEVGILRLGSKNEGLSEAFEKIGNIQLKGLIGNLKNSLCLEVKDGHITHGSVLQCLQGCLKGYAPTFMENQIKRTVDSVGLRRGHVYFKLMPTMMRGVSDSYAVNPVVIVHHQVNSLGQMSGIFWNIQNHSISTMRNRQLENYRVFLDTNWHVAYSNDEFGNSTYGFLGYLTGSILSGKRLRVSVKDRIYSVQITFIRDKTITAILTDIYAGDAWNNKIPVHMRPAVSSSNQHIFCTFESGSDRPVNIQGSPGSTSATWFIENRCWKEIITFDSENNLLSGTVQELFDVASTGKSLRLILTSPIVALAFDVIKVHLYNNSFVVLNSVVGVVSNSLKCEQNSYTVYSTGTVEFSNWTPGRVFNSIREIIKVRVQVLSEI